MQHVDPDDFPSREGENLDNVGRLFLFRAKPYLIVHNDSMVDLDEVNELIASFGMTAKMFLSIRPDGGPPSQPDVAVVHGDHHIFRKISAVQDRVLRIHRRYDIAGGIEA
ncbi:MAG: hypothetical protein AAF640_10180 [Pseudomonadota bacterium]